MKCGQTVPNSSRGFAKSCEIVQLNDTRSILTLIQRGADTEGIGKNGDILKIYFDILI